MVKFLKLVWARVADATQAYTLLLLIIPTGLASVVVGGLASFAGQSGWIVVLAGLAATAIVPLILAASYYAAIGRMKYLDETAVAGKLEQFNLLFAYDFEWDKSGKPVRITKMNIGVVLVNTSRSKLFYRFEYFHASVDGLTPNTTKLVGKTTEIAPKFVQGTHPDVIDFGKQQKTEPTGALEYKILYGEKGKLIHTLEKKFEFDLYLKKDVSKHPNGVVTSAVREKA